jgi:hypothetical protein
MIRIPFQVLQTSLQCQYTTTAAIPGAVYRALALHRPTVINTLGKNSLALPDLH